MKNKNKGEIIIYKTNQGPKLEVRLEKETVWLTQKQMANLFDKNVRTINEHIKNVFKENELKENSVIRKFRITAVDGKSYETNFYNLDVIISVGYRVKSLRGTQFRIWATKTLREHITKGFTINRKRVLENRDKFLQAVESMKKLLPSGGKIDAQDTLELVKMFALTWLSLEAYDKNEIISKGVTKKKVSFEVAELNSALVELKEELIRKKEASLLFGQEKQNESLMGIVGNTFQSFDKKDLYPTIEEKAAHLLYFMVKNHPYIDGNKRSGAFAFVWFLRRFGILNLEKITPESLATLTLLVAESRPKDKDRMIGLILMLIGNAETDPVK